MREWMRELVENPGAGNKIDGPFLMVYKLLEDVLLRDTLVCRVSRIWTGQRPVHKSVQPENVFRHVKRQWILDRPVIMIRGCSST
jgi:hypothetical protein